MNTKDFVVFDIEIRESPKDLPGGWEAKDKMGFACAVAWDNRDGRYRLFDEKNAADLVDLLSSVPLVVGFNHLRFDYKVLALSDSLNPGRPCIPACFDEGVYPETRGQGKDDFDILIELWRGLGLPPAFDARTHGKFGLDSVARHTLGPGYHKTGHGADAPYLYQRGEWARLFDYCQQDVKLTRDLWRFICARGYVVTEKGIVHL